MCKVRREDRGVIILICVIIWRILMAGRCCWMLLGGEYWGGLGGRSDLAMEDLY